MGTQVHAEDAVSLAHTLFQSNSAAKGALVAALMAFLAGCAQPVASVQPPSASLRESLGIVAVTVGPEPRSPGVPAPPRPRATASSNSRGSYSGPGAGAASGAMEGLGAAVSAGDPLSAAIGVILFVPIGAVAGAIAGAVSDSPDASAHELVASHQALASEWSGARPAHALLQAVGQRLDLHRQGQAILVEPPADASGGWHAAFAPPEAESVLYLQVDQFLALRGGSGAELAIGLNSSAQLRSAKDGAVLYAASWQYSGEAESYVALADGDAAPLRRDINAAIAATADSIVDLLFVADRPVPSSRSVAGGELRIVGQRVYRPSP